MDFRQARATLEHQRLATIPSEICQEKRTEVVTFDQAGIETCLGDREIDRLAKPRGSSCKCKPVNSAIHYDPPAFQQASADGLAGNERNLGC